MSEVEEKGARIIGALEARREDRGYVAELRRGLSADTDHRAWKHIAPWCDLTNDRQRHICTTVMAGYASHQDHKTAGNMGETLRQIATGGQGQGGLESFEARLRRILTCRSAQEACVLVAPLIRAAANKGVPIDFVQLYTDLTFWGDRVKVRWASSYWSPTETTDES